MSGIPWNDPGYSDRDVYEVGEDVERYCHVKYAG